MNKVLINQEFHEDVVELVTETCSKIIEEKDEDLLERLVQEKIDEAYDLDGVKAEVISEAESLINDAKDEIESDVEDRLSNMNDKMEEMETDIVDSIKREIPKLLERALVERKIDKEEIKEAVLELKEEWNKLIAEQVKYHFKILAGFMIDQSKS